MHNLQIIPLDNEHWDTIVANSFNYDFYHTRGYHELESNEESKPFLFVSYLEDDFIAIPLIKRKIENTPYFDCTSVYGYCGPISNLDINTISEKLITTFQKELHRYFLEDGIISVFSRLHPLLPQNNILNGFGIVLDLNKTVYIDTTKPIDEQRREYRKSNKSEINQLRGKKGYSVREATTDEEIMQFATIYKETMKRVDAKDYYFFDFDYFKKLIGNSAFESKLLLAYNNNEITAGAIFTITKDIMQYHLAGTKEEFSRDTPMKLVIDEARLLASERNLKFLHLGGGLAGSDEDSLFKFKAGFSKSRSQFSVWQLIVNPSVYDALVKEKGVIEDTSFFPKYRVKVS